MLPVALVGSVLAMVASGGVLSLGSLAGVIAVLGIAARNSIILIRRYQLQYREGEAFGPELIRRGTLERVGPIVMTAVATTALLLPFLLLGDIAGVEIIRPMAIVILGGLVTSTLVNLYLLPALYLRVGDGAAPEMDLEASL